MHLRAQAEIERDRLARRIAYPRAPVLEVGSGPCACLTLALARRGLQVIAIDRDAEALVLGRKQVRAAGLSRRVRFMVADASTAPFRDRAFRNIIACNALSTAPDPRAVLHDLHRILAPTGRLVVADWIDPLGGLPRWFVRTVRARFPRTRVSRRADRLLFVSTKPPPRPGRPQPAPSWRREAASDPARNRFMKSATCTGIRTNRQELGLRRQPA